MHFDIFILLFFVLAALVMVLLNVDLKVAFVCFMTSVAFMFKS